MSIKSLLKDTLKKFIDVFVQTVSNKQKITFKMWDVVFKANVYVKLKLHAQLHLNSVYCWWCGLNGLGILTATVLGDPADGGR